MDNLEELNRVKERIVEMAGGRFIMATMSPPTLHFSFGQLSWEAALKLVGDKRLAKFHKAFDDMIVEFELDDISEDCIVELTPECWYLD